MGGEDVKKKEEPEVGDTKQVNNNESIKNDKQAQEDGEVYEDYLNPRNAMDLVREVYYSDVPFEDVDLSFQDHIKHIETGELWYMIDIHSNNGSAGVVSVAVDPLTGHILSLEDHYEKFLLN